MKEYKEYVATIQLSGKDGVFVAEYPSMDLEAARDVADCIARHMSSKAKVRNVEESDEET